jgi:dethiobiotin synthetase
MKKYFITGIGTGVGKTIVSAILCEALQADYWKPVQCGNLDNTDSDTVRNLVSNNKTKIYKESYRLDTPASPHYAAAVENITLDPGKLVLPETDNQIIIEGAGGLMVPLNENFLMIDLIKKLNAEVILVSQNYLGSINHTLLSLETLKNRNIPVAGIVFNGEKNSSSENVIMKVAGIKSLLNISREPEINKNVICKYALELLAVL